MHEAGIAAGVVEIAEAKARERGVGWAVRRVGLRLGEFTGVVRDALEFAFEAIAPGMILEIETVPLIGGCPECLWTGPPERDFCLTCPRCGTPVTILSGREMEVAFVDIEPVEGEYGTYSGRNQSIEEERRVCTG